ncbi:MAG: hypothetical protein EXR72_11905 [Myxococcales bacterium]|nr:hypothetical protein [Myxococcales bacterium]
MGVQGLLSLSAGWTDNAAAQAQLNRSAFVGDVRPSLVLTFGIPRASHSLAYTFGYNFYFPGSENNNYSNRLAYGGYFSLSPTVEMLLGASITQGQVNGLLLQQGSAMTPLQVLPNNFTYFAGSVLEGLGWDLARSWHASQATTFSFNIPLDGQVARRSYDLANVLGFERAWRSDAVGLDLRIDYSHLGSAPGPISSLVVRQQLTTAALLKWRHDLGHFFSFDLGAGGLMVFGLNGQRRSSFLPTGTAVGRYTRQEGTAELSYGHTVAANVFVSQSFEVDQVALRASLPLGSKSRVTFSSAAGYQHARTVDAVNRNVTTSSTDVILVDGTLTWRPVPPLEIFTRYQYFHQLPSATPDLQRHMVLLGVNVIYPTEAAVVLPARLPMRFDSTDSSN